MLLIPAIDLKDGQCVQLRQGVMASASVYSDDPPEMARHWCALGARRLHVVDLDGAFAGKPVNRDLVERIAAAAGDVPVQIGGGIRSVETVTAYINAGVSQVILGTRALEDPGFLTEAASAYADRIILGLDARDGRAATRGWTAQSDLDLAAFVQSLVGIRLYAIVYTDVARDGMLTGVNAATMQEFARVSPVPVIASGGIRNLDDLAALKQVSAALDDARGDVAPTRRKLIGAISGSALYEGTLDFRAGQALLDG